MNHRILKSILAIVVAGTAATATSEAKVELPQILSDHLVLQQKSQANLWGKAAPSSKVTVKASWGTEEYSVKSDREGNWKLAVQTPAAGYTAYSITIADKDGAVTLSDVLVGEVWLCGGQSNMEMPLNGFWHCPVEGSLEEVALSGQYASKKDPGGSYNCASPAVMYNGMIYPIRNYTLKGFIWYQGETNSGFPQYYAQRLADMVKVWRDLWGLGEMPFYEVELAPFTYGGDGTTGARIREAQHKAVELIPGSGIASINDLAYPYEYDEIHPRRKKEVGERLSYLALNRTYGMDYLPCEGPRFKSYEVRGGEIEVAFYNGESGFSPWRDIVGFEIAGEDKVFHPAEIRRGTRLNTVIVKSGKVPAPVAVRYCFRDFQVGNFTGRRCLPVIPFRTDNW